jgi:hypothetical protein
MIKRKIDRLLFIFDADAGKWGAFVDSAKKILMLKGCALCTITHGILGEKAEWRDCKEDLGIAIDYVHRDEVRGELKQVVGDNLPCIVASTGGKYILLLTPDILERCSGSVSDLKERLQYHCVIKDLEWVA